MDPLGPRTVWERARCRALQRRHTLLSAPSGLFLVPDHRDEYCECPWLAAIVDEVAGPGVPRTLFPGRAGRFIPSVCCAVEGL